MSGNELVMPILKMARGFWQARILMAAAELDVFSHLLNQPKTAAQLAQELSSDGRATETLLNALAALEVLTKKDGAFRVRPDLKGVLSGSTPGSILPVILHMAQLWGVWGRLTEIVQKGKEGEPFDKIERDEEGVEAFIGAMHTIGSVMAEQVVARLDLTGKENLIDVGGGSGVYTISMLRKAPQMRATIFDRPMVIEIAKQKIAEAKLADRVVFREGDFYGDDIPGGHDIALLSAIIHQNSRRQNVDLYRRVLAALVPGGTIAIRDHVMSEDHTETVDGALFAINMLVATPAGNTYSFQEIKSDLEEAGFGNSQLLHRAEMDSLVTAQKPAD
jgi:predicted O-methyltransferase YrrM